MDTEAAAMQALGFSGDRIAQQSKDNATGAVLATIAYLHEQHRSPEEWVAYVGRLYAGTGWENLGKQGVKEAARMAALNWVSLGAILTAFTADETRAEFTLSWPPQDWLAELPLTQAQGDVFFGVFGPIAESVGLHYAWYREGEHVRSRFSQP